MFEKDLELDYFKENNYVRKVCPSCGAGFWAVDPEKKLCGDSQCCGYTFIGNPLIKEDFNLDSMRRKYLDFFVQNDHTELEPYPVVARWRDDIYLTIASIADFQPHVTSGRVKPPANPLTISQPCIRLNDLDNIGRSGRHLTEFEMMAHHVFNNPEEEIYWKEDTVRLCNELLVDDLGIPEKEITYREEPWFGGGNAGPALEAEVGGLELATLVFMNMERDPKGKYEIANERYSKMDMYIVDTGYGLERFLWMAEGTPTLYESIYPELLEKMYDAYGVYHDLDDAKFRDMVVEHVKLCGQMEISTQKGKRDLRETLSNKLNKMGHDISPGEIEKGLKPLESVFIIADHTKALTFMLADGIVPSNIKGGYLARLLLRRALRNIEDLGGEVDIDWIVQEHIGSLSNFPSVTQNKDMVMEMVERETDKYRDTLRKGKRIINRLTGMGDCTETEKVRKKKSKGAHISDKDMDTGGKDDVSITLDKMIELYDSHGIHPSVVKNVIEREGRSFTVPDGFSQMLAEKHAQGQEEVEKEEIDMDLPKTELLFYDDEYRTKAKGIIIAYTEHGLVLDRTVFYPEGGGQLGDTGCIRIDGKVFPVVDTIKSKETVFHVLDKKTAKNESIQKVLQRGKEVEMEIDWERRYSLMRHHTSTHIILGASRKVLGDHVWQQGAQKFPDRARFDISHFKRLTPEEAAQIEMEANKAVLEGKVVIKKWYTLDQAMDTFGSELFQGGPPKSENVRIVEVEEWDREACAGTHIDNTFEIGMIKIIHTERLQDGVERLEYSAGSAAVKYIQEREKIIEDTRKPLGVPAEKLQDTVDRFFKEWKEQKKEISRLKREVAECKQRSLVTDAVKIADIRFVFYEGDMDMNELQALGRELSNEEKVVAMLVSRTGGVKMLLTRSKDVDIDMNQLLRASIKEVRGSGGGRPNFAQGGGSYPEGIPKAKEVVISLLKEKMV